MRRLFATMIAGAMLAGGSIVYADGACCAGHGDSAKGDKAMTCNDTFSKLNLTEDQKSKLAALKADCMKTGCTPESRDKFMKGLKQILTADQYSQFQSACEKAAKAGCPMAQTEAKKN